jgi:pyruvate/2-oxoglutarate dehydrogenase complex dihydrolipoamide dehydrogenase (E3) component
LIVVVVIDYQNFTVGNKFLSSGCCDKYSTIEHSLIMPKVLVAGGGLVGALNAVFFAKRGWDVEVYELRKGLSLN